MSVIAADQRSAFDALYYRTHRKVLAYCVRRTSRWPDALDAAAETYVVAWRRFDDIPTGDGSLPWLFGIARRVIANERRTESRQDRVVAKLRSRGRTQPSGPDDLAVQDEEQAFAQLDETTMADITEGPRLGWFIHTHMLAEGQGGIRAEDLTTKSYQNPGARTLTPVTVEGEHINYGGANVIETDIEAENGIVHVIDGVVIPWDR